MFNYMMDCGVILERAPYAALKWKNSVGWPLEFASPNIKSLCGYESEEFLEQAVNFFDLLSHPDLEKLDNLIARSLKELCDEITLDCIPISHRSGESVWVEVRIYPLRSESNYVHSFLCFLMDISDRVTTKTKLESSREEIRAIVNALPDAILHINKSGIVKNFLPEHNGEKVFLSDVFPVEFASKLNGYLREAVTTKKVGVYEYEKKERDHTKRYFEARFSAITVEEGLIVIREITQKKQKEKQLIEAISEIKRASREKTKFLSNMSHELRTPLNAIMGFAQLLPETDPEVFEYSNEILSSSELLLGLLNDILDLSKIEAGHINLQLESVSLKNVVEESEKLVKPLAQKHGIKVEFASIPDLWFESDKLRMVQVLVNLLSNAIKYNQKNGQVKLSLECSDKDFCICVSDTGIGLTPEQLGNLFTPFERLGAEQSQIEGSGLGLALTKSLVEALGGELSVSSKPGFGSVFYVHMKDKITAYNETTKNKTTKNETTKKDQHSNGIVTKEGRKVVYVGNDTAMSKILRYALSKKKHALVTAATSEESVSLIQAVCPDLVLFQIEKSAISDEESEKAIRNIRNLQVPIVGVSTFDSFGLKSDIGTESFHTIIKLPSEMARLLELIDNNNLL